MQVPLTRNAQTYVHTYVRRIADRPVEVQLVKLYSRSNCHPYFDNLGEQVESMGVTSGRV